MRSVLKIIFGLILGLGSLWGMAYYRGHFPIGHWSDFPSFVTGVIGLIGGLPFAVNGFIELIKLTNKEPK